MDVHSHSSYFYHLSPHALILDPSKSLTSQLLDKHRLQYLMLKDTPVPPGSVIKTFSQLSPDEVELVFTVDNADLSTGGFVIRQGEFARFFLDVWFDPLYRDYNFVKAENHALVSGIGIFVDALSFLIGLLIDDMHFSSSQDHIIQWHPTILARLALVPQRTINAYSKDSPGAAGDGTYRDGDFVIRFFGCDNDTKRSCDKEMEPYYNSWQKKLSSE